MMLMNNDFSSNSKKNRSSRKSRTKRRNRIDRITRYLTMFQLNKVISILLLLSNLIQGHRKGGGLGNLAMMQLKHPRKHPSKYRNRM